MPEMGHARRFKHPSGMSAPPKATKSLHAADDARGHERPLLIGGSPPWCGSLSVPGSPWQRFPKLVSALRAAVLVIVAGTLTFP